MFASRITKDIDIQDGDSVVVVHVQKLSGRALQNARDARSTAQLAALRGASKDMLAMIRSPELDAAAEAVAAKRKAEAADPKLRTKARYGEYDRWTVLTAGIVRWSADVPLPAGVDDLDEPAAQTLHEAILDLSLPPLDPAVIEAELGKG